MFRRRVACLLVCLCVSVSETAGAGIRAPGRYSGVVIFDRWGGCILFSGIYLMYVSEEVKEQLRPYGGQAVEIYAFDVFQPVNPGDGLIRRFDILGPAEAKQHSYTYEGTKLEATPVAVAPPHITVALTITNEGTTFARIESSQIGFALLAQKTAENNPLSPSDGPSTAVITRTDVLSSQGRWSLRTAGGVNSYSFVVADEDRLPQSFDLAPNESRSTRIAFMLPSGHYQFFAGYGGGVHEEKLVVSNPVSIEFW